MGNPNFVEGEPGGRSYYNYSEYDICFVNQQLLVAAKEQSRDFEWPDFTLAFPPQYLYKTENFYRCVFGIKPDISQEDFRGVDSAAELKELCQQNVNVPKSIKPDQKGLVLRAVKELIESDSNERYLIPKLLIKVNSHSYTDYENLLKQIYLLIPPTHRYRIGFTISPNIFLFMDSYHPEKRSNILMVPDDCKLFDDIG